MLISVDRWLTSLHRWISRFKRHKYYFITCQIYCTTSIKRYLYFSLLIFHSSSMNAYLSIYNCTLCSIAFRETLIIYPNIDLWRACSYVFCLGTETSSWSLVDRWHRSRMRCDTSSDWTSVEISQITFCE